MYSAIIAIFELLGIIAKNPLVQKMATFSFFFTLLSFFIDYFVSAAISPIISSSQILSIACYLGFFESLKIVLTFLVSGFVAKQFLAFVRS